VDEVKAVMLLSPKLGCADIRILSSDTTAQELPIGSPNEPGIVRVWRRGVGAPWRSAKPARCWGRYGTHAGADEPQDGQRTPLFAQGQEEKRQVLTRLWTEVGQLVVQTRRLVKGLERAATV